MRITSKKEFKQWIQQDKYAARFNDSILKHKIKCLLGINSALIMEFLFLLRKEEYYLNNSSGKFLAKYYSIRKENLGRKLGFEIPPNVFGPGLRITHTGLRIVNGNARVGSNCLLHSDVNIGTNGGIGEQKVPIIGNNVYIGPGVKIFGDIKIADNIAIGANAVVNKSFSEEGITIAGTPARKISSKGSEGKIRYSEEALKNVE